MGAFCSCSVFAMPDAHEPGTLPVASILVGRQRPGIMQWMGGKEKENNRGDGVGM